MVCTRGTSFLLDAVFTMAVGMFCAAHPAAAQNCTSCLGSALEVPGGIPANSTSNVGEWRSARVGSAETVGESWTIRRRVDEVMVFFTATKGHKFVDDLTEQEVSVKDDSKPPARISSFRHQRDLPLRVALLIDSSNSVHYRFKFEQQASSSFLRKIVRSGMDQAFVMGFSEQVNLGQDYTDDLDKLARGVSALSPDGGTALFDAVRASCWKLARSADQGPTARILVLLSDGDDNASKSTLEHALETAQREEVTIYAISTNNSGYARPGDKILKDLAVQTGGQFFWSDRAREIVNAFTSIAQEMRSRYALAYQPADLREDGRFHRIEIKAQRSNKKFRVHARTGYYAPLTLVDN